jgi:non-lysosomal glucosylceramidase
VLAQWHANLCGLGEIFDREQTRSALKSIYRYNFKKSMRDVFNPNRIYCLDDEAGVLICAWPENALKPAIPVPYSDECWPGCEYQVAAHMIQEGLVEEGMDIVRGVRSRFDGIKRNPWNEFECGSNYARSMSSYSLLLAFSGFTCDLVSGEIGFNPIHDGSYFFSVDSGWGILERKADCTTIKILMGELKLNSVKLPYLGDTKSAEAAGRAVAFNLDPGDKISFETPIRLAAGESLIITH